MYQVKATRPKNPSTLPVTEPASSHAEAVGAMIRLMKDYATVEIERANRLGFRHTGMVGR